MLCSGMKSFTAFSIICALVRYCVTQMSAATTSIVQGSTIPISEVLSESSVSTTFFQYWNASRIGYQLPGGATFTLFVPINSAWTNLSGTDQAALASCLASSCSQLAIVIKYHMWVGMYLTNSFASGAGGICGTKFGLDNQTEQCLTYAVQLNGAQTHVALTQAGGSWYVNGAKIVLADQMAKNFVVHFIDSWLYPIDTGTTAQAYLSTATSSPSVPSASLVSLTCSLCSPVFSNVWSSVTSGETALTSFYSWSQSTAGSRSGSVTMFIPYSQPLSTQYSINTLASMISAADVSALSYIAAPHVIPNRVLFLGAWIAGGSPMYSCGPSNLQSMPQYVQSCDLVQFNSTSWIIEVTGDDVITAAFIIYPNIPVENGVVHIVSNILNFEYGNLWSIVKVHPQLNKFKAFLQSDTTGVALRYLQNSQNQNSYTVFAPDDSSWSAVSTEVSNNATILSSLLQLGIVQGTITFSALQSTLTSANTVSWSSKGVFGNQLRFTSNLNTFGLEVDGGYNNGFVQTLLTQPDLGATNGILHVVSGNVFGVPPMTIAEFLLSRPDLTTSQAYFSQMTQAWGLFSKASGTYTLIVPTNNAWAVLGQSSQLSVISTNRSALLLNVLLRHYVGTNAQLFGNLVATGSSFTAKTLNGAITFTAVSMSPPQFQVSYAGLVSANVNASDYICSNGRVHIINSVLAVNTDAYNLKAGYSCQDPNTCSASAMLVNVSLLLFGVMLRFINRCQCTI